MLEIDFSGDAEFEPLRFAPTPRRSELTREEIAAEIIKEFEGLHDLHGDQVHAYYCPANILTIGYGHTGEVEECDIISIAQAERLLRQDMADAMDAVETLEGQCPTPLTEHQAGALISFAFNVGGAGLLRAKSVAGRMRNGDYAGAADGLLKYVYAGGVRFKGLERRRERERHVFLTDPPRRKRVPIEAVEEDEPARTAPVEAPERSVTKSTTVIAATTGALATVTATIEAATGLSGDAQRYVLLGLGAAVLGTLIYVLVERIRKNRRGEEF